MNCRSCTTPLSTTVIDLGFAPPSNAYLTKEQLALPEKTYPLRVLLCKSCWLVQTEDFLDRDDVFDSEYHYFSSTSLSWVEHSKNFADSIVKELGLNSENFVVEVASNDGYLLHNFVSVGIPCLGIEPTASTAVVSQQRGIPTLIEFFGQNVAKKVQADYRSADLIIGNNVFAHVPDLNDFCEGIFTLLSAEGVCTLEFPHLLSLLRLNQFDTIYHEHFSYLSLIAVIPLLQRHNLRIFRVDRLVTHGGSLRLYICKINSRFVKQPSVDLILDEERVFGLDKLSGYEQIWDRAKQMKVDLINFLTREKEAGRVVAGYGAAAKGNTFLNYAGIDSTLIHFVVDAAKAKQCKFLPGSHIPIYSPEALSSAKPDVVLILPWNIADEVLAQNGWLLELGCEFYVAVPALKKLS
jgi:hypothetical protein